MAVESIEQVDLDFLQKQIDFVMNIREKLEAGEAVALTKDESPALHDIGQTLYGFSVFLNILKKKENFPKFILNQNTNK